MTLHLNETDDNDDDVMYEPDEQSPTKYNIVLCELYNDKIHGNNENSTTHYLVIGMFKCLDIRCLREMSSLYNRSYVEKINTITPHSHIRNYGNIVVRPYYVKPEIAQCILLSSGEQICIIKTIWIRLIQRAWRNVYKRYKTPSIRGLLLNRTRVTS